MRSCLYREWLECARCQRRHGHMQGPACIRRRGLLRCGAGRVGEFVAAPVATLPCAGPAHLRISLLLRAQNFTRTGRAKHLRPHLPSRRRPGPAHAHSLSHCLYFSHPVPALVGTCSAPIHCSGSFCWCSAWAVRGLEQPVETLQASSAPEAELDFTLSQIEEPQPPAGAVDQ